MNQTGSQSQQNYKHDTHGCQHSASDVFAHGLAWRIVFQHNPHSQKQIYNHVNKQRHNNDFNQHKPSRQTFYSSRRWLLGLSLTVLAILIMVRLGVWQLERMEEKSLRLASIAQKKLNGPLSLTELKNATQDIRDYPVAFYGRLQSDYIIYLDNQIENGGVGYQVLAPVTTNAGQVLVNFGWVAASTSRAQLPKVLLPARLTSAQGIVSIPENNPVVRETAHHIVDGTLLIQQVDLQHIEKVTQQDFVPYVVQLQQPSDTQFVRNWQPVVMPPDKHLGYAIQWFGLAIAAAVIAGIVFFSRGKSHVQTKQK